jgi:cytochrome P450
VLSAAGGPRASSYPIGAALTEAALVRDPYPAYRALLRKEPISWIEALSMWWVVRYDDVVEILKNDSDFGTASERSTIYDTFGDQMLSSDGERHRRYRSGFRDAFQAKAVRDGLAAQIAHDVDRLIDGLSGGRCELRREFAARLPVLTMLRVLGLPPEDEARLRRWYDQFEAALANFTWRADIRAAGRRSAEAFSSHLREAIARERAEPTGSLLGRAVAGSQGNGLDDAAISRNAAVILFGGISTVEALLLNCVWAISSRPPLAASVVTDPAACSAAVDEVMRWQPPVQSATRHVRRDVEFRGHVFREGEVVNCMLAAANRDPERFGEPDIFRPGRSDSARHLAFATGPHLCLGLHLAGLEAQIALRTLYARLPGLALDPKRPSRPEGYEFRQPRELHLVWNP